MTTHRNLYACLVHEQVDCVADLVRNLRHLDPASEILLYDGSADSKLLDRECFERLGAQLHPAPRPMKWGYLHGFAIDCMRHGLEHVGFDTLTIVDSDQLAIRPGFSLRLGEYLAGRDRVGILTSAPHRQQHTTRIGPARAAWNEVTLWRELSSRFPEAEQSLFYWTFWPTTVFTADACRDLVSLFEDDQLTALLGRSKLWATEEVLFPTLTRMLGYEVEANPSSYAYVRYRAKYRVPQLDKAMATPDCFWAHPVPRLYTDPLRQHVRQRHDNYRVQSGSEVPAPNPKLLCTLPLLQRIKRIHGWLEDSEADLLIGVAREALAGETPANVVEVGSFCGRATVLLGTVARSVNPEAHVFAVDAFDGIVGSNDGRLQRLGPTGARFRQNVTDAGLDSNVTPLEIVDGRRPAVNREIALLLIDGLHDYASVAADFAHYQASVPYGGYVAFHDYATYFPGVMAFVDEVRSSASYVEVARVSSLIVLQKVEGGTVVVESPATVAPPALTSTASVDPISNAADPGPLVSCIMPTADRRAFVPRAIDCFLAQDYPNRELIVVDDGRDDVSDLMPDHPRIRYHRIPAGQSLGEKRNTACRAAAGDIIVHWDDDDWSASWRITYQVNALRRGGLLCGLRTLLYYEFATGRAWRYSYPNSGRRWVAGNTLCYTKSAWERSPFPGRRIGEDNAFVRAHNENDIVVLDDDTFYVAAIHPGNVAPKRTHIRTCWQPLDASVILDVMGTQREHWGAQQPTEQNGMRDQQ